MTLYRSQSTRIASPPVRAGDVVVVGRMAGPQYERPVRVHVDLVRHHVDGWAWIECRTIDDAGRRGTPQRLYVLLSGLYPAAASQADP